MNARRSGPPPAPEGWTIAVDGGPSVVVRPTEQVTVGRSARCDLRVTDDPRVSRVQFRASADATGGLTVSDESGGRSPLFSDGERVDGPLRLHDRTRLAAGRTRFRLSPPAAIESSTASDTVYVGDAADGSLTHAGTLSEGALTFDLRTLAAVPVTRPDRRFEAVARLPEVLRTPDDAARLPALCGLILAGVQDADAVAVVARHAPDGRSDQPRESFKRKEWAGRNELAGPPPIPHELVAAALSTGEAILTPEAGGWVFVVPIVDPDHAGSAPRGVLVRGTTAAAPAERAADVRFVSLVAEIVAAADRSGRLESQAAALRPFLPPRVLEELGEAPDPAALAPAECVASVLFCDLRGFSRTSEQFLEEQGSAGLPALLARVSAALSVMTRRIREAGGVTGDFLGDAALAFWGWPTADPTAPVRAAAAAVKIAADFALPREPDDPLAGFRVGVGVATGPAVAGRIGTEDQVKITVFGPTANFASRLEGLCGPLRVAGGLRRGDRGRGAGRRRRSGLQIAGPPAGYGASGEDDADGNRQRTAPAGGGSRRSPTPTWPATRTPSPPSPPATGRGPRRSCRNTPPPTSPRISCAIRLAEHHRTAPPGWDGVIRMDAK